jgi:cytochrome c oxidase subunit IV
MNAIRGTLRPILLTWAGLLALTLITSLAGLVNLGAMTPAIAVVIAAIQACLIAAFLMHALRGPMLVRVVVAGGVIWFLILMTLTSVDYLTRGWLLPSGK